jgi:hypothetical protein
MAFSEYGILNLAFALRQYLAKSQKYIACIWISTEMLFTLERINNKLLRLRLTKIKKQYATFEAYLKRKASPDAHKCL